MYKTMTQEKTTVHDFPSIDSLLSESLKEFSLKNKGTGQALPDSASWLGVSGGHEGWRSYARAGAQEEQRRIKDLARNITMGTPKGIRTRRRAIRGRQGDELDIHSVRSGNLDRAWRRTHKVEKEGKAKRITIIYSTDIHSGQKSNEAFFGPAAAAVLCQKLNEGKVATEIIATRSATYIWQDNPNVISSAVIVRVKNTHAPLSLASLAITATAGFSRTAIFSVWCVTDLRAGGKLGIPKATETTKVVQKYLGTATDRKIIVLPPLTSENEAKEFITKTLEEISK